MRDHTTRERWRGWRHGWGRRLGLGLGGLLSATSAPASLPAQPSQQQASAAPVPPPLASAAAPLVLRGVTVIDVRTGRRLPERTVVIAGNRIQALGRPGRVRIPRTARVVDARGKYLIPGLWDLHVHPMEYADVAFPLFLANGVTGVRDAGSPVPLATFGQWKREIAQGIRVGPRLIVSGPSLDSPTDTTDTVNVVRGSERARGHLAVPRAAARRVVDSLYAAGADMLKIYEPSREVRLALIAAAKRLGLRFGGHASDDLLGPEFSDSGATLLDHGAMFGPEICQDPPLAYFDGPRCAAAAQRLWQNHTWITVTGWLGVRIFERQFARARRYDPDSATYAQIVHTIQTRPGLRGDTARLDSLAAAHEPTSEATWEQLIADSNDAGRPLVDSLRRYGIRLPVVVGTDAGLGSIAVGPLPGFAVHDALFALARHHFPWEVAAYMQPTRLAALQTATLNPALALGAADSLGTVETGKRADLVLLDADPLADIWNTTKIRAVVADGRYYDRAALDGLLAAAHRAALASRARGHP